MVERLETWTNGHGTPGGAGADGRRTPKNDGALAAPSFNTRELSGDYSSSLNPNELYGRAYRGDEYGEV